MQSHALHQVKDPVLQRVKELAPLYTDEQTKEIYFKAYYLYREEKYAEATQVFRFLTVSYPLEPKYVKGLAACLQMQKDYTQALKYYLYLEIINKDQPDPYLYIYIADCYFALHEIANGLNILEIARLKGEEQKDEKILNHVALMRELWFNKSDKIGGICLKKRQ